MRTPAAYGTWPSPIPASLLVQAAVRLGDVRSDGDALIWLEGRPAEGGRYQLVRRTSDGAVVDVLPEGFAARTRVHEYGGGSFWVHNGVLFFTNWTDQRLCRLSPDGHLMAITPEPPEPHSLRYADGELTADGHWVLCVRERHQGQQASEVVNEIVALPSDGSGDAVVLVANRNFVSNPRLSPDGTMLAWVGWDHPNMPWDDTELWVADLTWTAQGPTMTSARRVAGGPGESVMQPVWAPDGALYVISDRSNWWHVYRVDGPDQLTAVDRRDVEVGGPAWVFGQRDLAAGPAGLLVWVEAAGRTVELAVSFHGSPTRHRLPFTTLERLSIVDDAVIGVAGWATKEPEIVRLPLADPSNFEVLRPARDLGLDPVGLSVGRRVSYPSSNGRTAHAIVYPPTSVTHEGLPGELPPLLVTIHGGPTAAANPAFSLETQFWTSRGFAVVDVDYGGSTGYGRRYRKELEGLWGIVDVDDCCAAATWLAEQGLVDRRRLGITGGSAGGFTTLAALATRDVFTVGASYYGVADLGALAADTHKFESRYLDRLVGPWPDTTGVYRDRSPLSHIDGLNRPLIVFQGLEDAIVPPNQSQMIVDALAATGVRHEYHTYEGEQHGFRQAETIVHSLEAELAFYRSVFTS